MTDLYTSLQNFIEFALFNNRVLNSEIDSIKFDVLTRNESSLCEVIIEMQTVLATKPFPWEIFDRIMPTFSKTKNEAEAYKWVGNLLAAIESVNGEVKEQFIRRYRSIMANEDGRYCLVADDGPFSDPEEWRVYDNETKDYLKFDESYQQARVAWAIRHPGKKKAEIYRQPPD